MESKLLKNKLELRAMYMAMWSVQRGNMTMSQIAN